MKRYVVILLFSCISLLICSNTSIFLIRNRHLFFWIFPHIYVGNCLVCVIQFSCRPTLGWCTSLVHQFFYINAHSKNFIIFKKLWYIIVCEMFHVIDTSLEGITFGNKVKRCETVIKIMLIKYNLNTNVRNKLTVHLCYRIRS